MLLRIVSSPLLGATCAVLVDALGRVVVVDPGAGVADRVADLVEDNSWTPVAVLITHGHVDHTWDSGALSARWGVPVHVHEADAYRLADPFGTLGPLGEQLRAMVGGTGPVAVPAERLVTHAVPAQRVARFDLAPDLGVDALHLPGHTQGSTAYLVDVEGTATVLTGDVLFAGTIGRTDLPGGDAEAMGASLGALARLHPDTVVVAGHGPSSTIGAELRTNPYLRAAR